MKSYFYTNLSCFFIKYILQLTNYCIIKCAFYIVMIYIDTVFMLGSVFFLYLGTTVRLYLAKNNNFVFNF